MTMSVKHGVNAPSAPLKSRFTNLRGTRCPILGYWIMLSHGWVRPNI